MNSPAETNPAPQPPADPKEAETRQWGLILHLSGFAGYIVPLAGFIAPIVIWQVKKSPLPGIDAHGKNAVNWMITEVILAIVCVLLAFVVVGIPLLVALAVAGVVFRIIAAIKANNGEAWRYPMSFNFLK